jgi:hypothetical protein
MDINKLIKLAKSYDTVGLYHEADKIMIKLAQANSAVYVAPTTARRFVNNRTNEDFSVVPPGKFTYSKDEDDKRYERFNLYSEKISEATNAKTLKNIRDFITNKEKKPIGNDAYGIFTLVNYINQFLNLKPNFNVNDYSQTNETLAPNSKDSGYKRNQIDVMAPKQDGGDSVSLDDVKSAPGTTTGSGSTPTSTTPPSGSGFAPGVTKVGDVFKTAKFDDYFMGEMAYNIIIPDKNAYEDLLLKIQGASTQEGLSDLDFLLKINYGLSITLEEGLYTIGKNTSESESPKAQPLAAPKNPVQMSHPVADVNVQQYNLNRQRKQETNQNELRSEWNGYIQGDSFLQSLKSRLKDIHNQVNPYNRSEVYNDGMIATIESKGPEYNPIIEMYKARKNNTYKNVGDLGQAQMYGTK